MLHSREALCRPHDLPQTLLIKLVGERPRRPAVKHSPHRDHMILFGHVLMNRIVGKPSQRKPSAREKHFDLIGSREFLDAVEDATCVFFSQHSIAGCPISLASLHEKWEIFDKASQESLCLEL